MSEPSIQDRAAGTILGAAIGDAMGHRTEFMNAEEIRRTFPPNGVQGYELWWERDGRRFAPYTDDTQMAEIVLRALLRGRRVGSDLEAVMRDLATGFVEWRVNPQGGHRAPGNACLAGASQLARGVHWSVAGGETAGGCGSVMRAYPFGLVLRDDMVKVEAWSIAHSQMTHRDPIALAACAAMAVGVALTLRGHEVRLVLDAMVDAAARHSGPTAAMMRRAISEARDGADPDVVLRRLQGWAAHEAISAAVFVVARHPADPASAILEGANADGDSDSIATLAGALVGARIGIHGLPSEWVRDLERSEELCALSVEAVSMEGGESRASRGVC